MEVPPSSISECARGGGGVRDRDGDAARSKSEQKESDVRWTRRWLHDRGLLCGLNQLSTVRVTLPSELTSSGALFCISWGWREVEERRDGTKIVVCLRLGAARWKAGGQGGQ